MCGGAAAPLVPLGCLVGFAGPAAMPRCLGRALPMRTWWEILLHLQPLQVPADRQKTVADPRGLCRNTYILSSENRLGSMVEFTGCTECRGSLNSRLTCSHRHCEQLLGIEVGNRIPSYPPLLGAFITFTLN